MTSMDRTADRGPRPARPGQEQKAWYWYDWANRAYVTTVAHRAVRAVPDRRRRARPPAARDRRRRRCSARPSASSASHLAAGSLPFYLITLRHDPVARRAAGRRRDRRPHRAARSGCWPASPGSARCFAALLFFVHRRQLAARRGRASWCANLCLGCSPGRSTTRSCCDISTEDERDRVSSRGWAFGYLGGGLLLAVNLVLVLGHDAVGLDQGWRSGLPAVRRRSGGPAFTIIPFRAAARTARRQRRADERAALVQRSFGQLLHTLQGPAQLPDDADLPARLPVLQRRHPDRDHAASVVRREGARLRQHGADRDDPAGAVRRPSAARCSSAGSPAGRRQAGDPGRPGRLDGDRRRSRCSCRTRTSRCSWSLGVAIGIVLGGTQALVPVVLQPADPPRPGGGVLRLYHACDRGTSWFGTLVFGLVLPAHRLLPAGDLRADRVLRPRRGLPAPGRPRAGHPRGRQRGAGRVDLTHVWRLRDRVRRGHVCDSPESCGYPVPLNG